MKHAYAAPALVATTVRSLTHSRFGASAEKSRPTRSPGRASRGPGRVLHSRRWRVAPRRPAARIRRAVWSRPISWPARRAASHSLRAPYTPKFAL